MDLWCKILLLTVHLFSLCINLLATILILKYVKHKQAGHQTLMDRVKTHYLITLSTHGAIFCLLPIGLILHEYMDYVVIQSISLLLSYSLLLLLFNILLFVVVRWVLGRVLFYFFAISKPIAWPKLWYHIGRSHTKFQPPRPLLGQSRPRRSFSFYVLEVKNPRSEFWVEIKILLYKSTPGNTKITILLW